MTEHDTGVTELLRRASDDLAPDVDRLVRGGITRGRSRQRRARIGTTVASLAVIGVVGGIAAVVPHVGPGGSAGETGVATETTSTPSPSPTPSPTAPDPTGPPRDLALTAPEIPDLMTSLFPGTVTPAAERTGGIMDGGPRQQIAHFLWNGTLVSVSATRDRVTAESSCAGDGVTCTTREDGSTLLTWQQTGPEADGGVTGRGVSLFGTDGWQVSAISYNAADGKDAPLLAPEPPLTYDDLEQIVTSTAWFG